jgi:ABC-type amino acid transport substrate-binding protein
LALLGTFAISDAITFQWKKLIVYCVVTAVLILCALSGTKLLFSYVITNDYTKYTEFIEMDLVGKRVKSEIKPLDQLSALTREESQQPRLQLIRRRGSLRVGYGKDTLPFVFRNKSGNLVGFDVDMVHQLARELDVTLEFVKIDRDDFVEQLNSGRCDVIMGGLAITTDRLSEMAFSEEYMDETLAFVVDDHNREAFSSRESIMNMKSLKLGIPDSPYYIEKIKKIIPHARLKVLKSPREFLTDKKSELDGFVYSAEAGSAWTLIYPRYSVAFPFPDIIKIPVAYAVPLDEQEMINFISTWVRLKKKDKTIESIYNHWILGKAAKQKEPRWCVMRDVLGWMD